MPLIGTMLALGTGAAVYMYRARAEPRDGSLIHACRAIAREESIALCVGYAELGNAPSHTDGHSSPVIYNAAAGAPCAAVGRLRLPVRAHRGSPTPSGGSGSR